MQKKKQKSKQPFHFSLTDPMYKGSFFVIFGDLDYFKTILSKKYKGVNVSDVTDMYEGLYITVTDGVVDVGILWFNEFKGVPYDANKARHIANITHELSHAVHSALGYRGFKLTDDSQEAYAYYQGWLMEEILKRLEKRK